MSNCTANPEELVNTKETAHDQQQAKSAKKQDVMNKRSQLKKLCDAYKWKQPVYECCKEEGPSHLRMFTFKVVMEIKKEPSEPNTEVECFSAPHSTKKAAAEHAAEGALWYLSKLGYY